MRRAEEEARTLTQLHYAQKGGRTRHPHSRPARLPAAWPQAQLSPRYTASPRARRGTRSEPAEERSARRARRLSEGNREAEYAGSHTGCIFSLNQTMLPGSSLKGTHESNALTARFGVSTKEPCFAFRRISSEVPCPSCRTRASLLSFLSQSRPKLPRPRICSPAGNVVCARTRDGIVMTPSL